MDRKIFEKEMARLQLRFDRDVDPIILDDYFDILVNDYQLTTEEFQVACRTIRSEARQFPIPKDFETVVRPDGDELAVLEWQAIVEFWELPTEHRESLQLSPEGEQAYKALGGRKLTERDMHDYRLIRDFSTLRRSFAKKAKVKALPALSMSLPTVLSGRSVQAVLPGSSSLPKTIGSGAGETILTPSAN